eukprot:gene41492-biopygen33241
MYQYTEFDRQFVHQRAAQFRDQLERWQKGRLHEDEFRPLRLQNGWYVQRYAPMLRVAVPYGELSSRQIRVLARIAREYDEPEAEVYRKAIETQGLLGSQKLPTHYAHFSTRQNVQFNWIPLAKSADVMDLLALVDMHGIQTSGNCIRNITSDERAGIAIDEIADPRPYAEIMRQWSTLHPEFAFLPRKFKIAITGATEVIESFIRKASVSRKTPSPEKPITKPQTSRRCGTGSLKLFFAAGSGGRRGRTIAAHSATSVTAPKIRKTGRAPSSSTIQAPPTSDKAWTRPMAARLAPTRLPALARSLTA